MIISILLSLTWILSTHSLPGSTHQLPDLVPPLLHTSFCLLSPLHSSLKEGCRLKPSSVNFVLQALPDLLSSSGSCFLFALKSAHLDAVPTVTNRTILIIGRNFYWITMACPCKAELGWHLLIICGWGGPGWGWVGVSRLGLHLRGMWLLEQRIFSA